MVVTVVTDDRIAQLARMNALTLLSWALKKRTRCAYPWPVNTELQHSSSSDGYVFIATTHKVSEQLQTGRCTPAVWSVMLNAQTHLEKHEFHSSLNTTYLIRTVEGLTTPLLPCCLYWCWPWQNRPLSFLGSVKKTTNLRLIGKQTDHQSSSDPFLCKGHRHLLPDVLRWECLVSRRFLLSPLPLVWMMLQVGLHVGRPTLSSATWRVVLS